MERRKALALASTATLLVGSTIVSVASVSGASFLGFGGSSHAYASAGSEASGAGSASGVVHKTRNIYDRYMLDMGNGSTGTAGADEAGISAPPDFTGTTVPAAGLPSAAATPTTRPPSSAHTPAKSPGASKTPSPSPTTEPGDTTPATVPPTTSPTYSTTTMPTTTTTWPRGVPRDWPKNKPIPPMPPNCQQPQLEDNGVWNCDH